MPKLTRAQTSAIRFHKDLAEATDTIRTLPCTIEGMSTANAPIQSLLLGLGRGAVRVEAYRFLTFADTNYFHKIIRPVPATNIYGAQARSSGGAGGDCFGQRSP